MIEEIAQIALGVAVGEFISWLVPRVLRYIAVRTKLRRRLSSIANI